MAMSGLFHVRTEISNLLVILSVAHHPKQTNREFPGHGDLGDLSPAPVVLKKKEKKYLTGSGVVREAMFQQLSLSTCLGEWRKAQKE